MKGEALSLVFGDETGAAVYDSFWRFAHERQRIFYKRAAGRGAPWTADTVLNQYRFTNVYRAADRVSQYLIRSVIYSGSPDVEEVVFRVLLFKLFNKIETWELLESQLGFPEYKRYRREHYLKVLGKAIRDSAALYSAAYIMAPPSGPYLKLKKHEAHLRLIESMMKSGLPLKLQRAKSLRECFELLSSFPMIGDFLGFQLAIDLNYTEAIDFDEMSFVVAGPGAKSGIAKCFGPAAKDYESIIRHVTDHQDEEFRKRGITFQKLGDRPLQLIDVQNLFCEIDKYTRVTQPSVRGIGERTRIKRKFVPKGPSPEYWFPPKWKINAKIAEAIDSSRRPALVRAEDRAMRSEYKIAHLGAQHAVDLDNLQRAQAEHDKISHTDILALPIQDRLKHFVLHFAKYVGALVGDDERASRRVIVDSFIICLAAANALRLRLKDRVPTPKSSTVGFQEFTRNMAMATGKMAKACEAMDHLEKFDFRGELEKGIIDVAAAILASQLDVSGFVSEIHDRWRQVEGRRNY